MLLLAAGKETMLESNKAHVRSGKPWGFLVVVEKRCGCICVKWVSLLLFTVRLVVGR
jgi:hypothetical protein